jgi:hypothetical protein
MKKHEILIADQRFYEFCKIRVKIIRKVHFSDCIIHDICEFSNFADFKKHRKDLLISYNYNLINDIVIEIKGKERGKEKIFSIDIPLDEYQYKQLIDSEKQNVEEYIMIDKKLSEMIKRELLEQNG